MGQGYVTEAATLQCVCGIPVDVAGKGVQSWKVNGSPILTEEGLKKATLTCPKPPVGLGCTKVHSVVAGKAGKAKAGGQTPLVQSVLAITDMGGLVQVMALNSTAAKTGGAGDDGPPERPPEKLHKPDPTKTGELKFQLKDRDNKPVVGEWFRVTLPNGTEAHGLLDADGRGAVSGIDPAARCRLALPNLKYTRWYPEGQRETAAETYTTRDGDTLSAVATRYQLPRWQTLWDFWGNTDLRQDRCNPNSLSPGQAVCVPRPDRELVAGNQLHTLQLKQCHPKRTLTFRFVDATTGRPMPDLTVRLLEVDSGQAREVVTNKYGEIVIDGPLGQIFAVKGVVKPTCLSVGDPALFAAGFHRSLDDLLRDTLIGATAPGTWHDLKDTIPSVVLPHERPAPPDAGLPDKSLWGVSVPPGPLVKVTNLVCVTDNSHSSHSSHSSHAGHGTPPPIVCESIEWEPFVLTVDGVTRKLDLAARYKVRVQFLTGGEVRKDSHWLWPLEAKVDFGLQNAFAYQLDPGPNGPELNPVPADVCLSPRFLPPPAAGPITAAIGQPPVDIPVIRHRVVTVTSLVCNKPRADFEPGGVMVAARVYPLAMFVANFPLERVVGTIRVRRPAEQHPHDPDTMRAYMRVALYTDNNNALVPAPTWGSLFAYYNVVSPAGQHTVVYQRTGEPVKLAWGHSSQDVRRPPADWLPTDASAESLEKQPGQGAYDNIHIAPPMYVKPPPFPPLTGQNLERAIASFADIMMAPFCVHDCYHTHWRWAPPRTFEVNQRERKGWSLDGKPYSTPGAPLASPNQTVTVTVSGTGFHYQADIDRPRPGEWQVVMHHGSAYSIAENPDPPLVSAKKMRLGFVTGLSALNIQAVLNGATGVFGGATWIPPGSTEWPLFYWHLRYMVQTPKSSFLGEVAPGNFMERNPVAADAALRARISAG